MTQDWHIRKSQQAEGEKALVGSAFDWVLKNPGKTVLDMPPAMYSGLRIAGTWRSWRLSPGWKGNQRATRPSITGCGSRPGKTR